MTGAKRALSIYQGPLSGGIVRVCCNSLPLSSLFTSKPNKTWYKPWLKEVRCFFSKRGYAQTLHQNDAYSLYWFILSFVHRSKNVTNHGSERVDTWINHLNNIWDVALVHISNQYACVYARRTGCINPWLPSPKCCTQNPWPGDAPLVGDKTTYGSNG